jgi:GSH-dependent disulfide-bond oxidoreductase
LQVFSEDH